MADAADRTRTVAALHILFCCIGDDGRRNGPKRRKGNGAEAPLARLTGTYCFPLTNGF